MNNPTIVKLDRLILGGFCFFGDPFRSSAGWTEENEIGRTWQRLMNFIKARRETLSHFRMDASYELHLLHPESEQTGEYEIFVGLEYLSTPAEHPFSDDEVPFEMCVKILPASTYAVFHLEGAEISSDWHALIYKNWMDSSGYIEAYPFSFQLYDEQFKGLDQIEDSVLDVYMPVKPADEN